MINQRSNLNDFLALVNRHLREGKHSNAKLIIQSNINMIVLFWKTLTPQANCIERDVSDFIFHYFSFNDCNNAIEDAILRLFQSECQRIEDILLQGNFQRAAIELNKAPIYVLCYFINDFKLAGDLLAVQKNLLAKCLSYSHYTCSLLIDKLGERTAIDLSNFIIDQLLLDDLSITESQEEQICSIVKNVLKYIQKTDLRLSLLTRYNKISLLHLAAENNLLECIKTLLDSDVVKDEERISLMAPDYRGRTPLHYAIFHRQIEAIAQLIQFANTDETLLLLKDSRIDGYSPDDKNVTGYHLAFTSESISDDEEIFNIENLSDSEGLSCNEVDIDNASLKEDGQASENKINTTYSLLSYAACWGCCDAAEELLKRVTKEQRRQLIAEGTFLGYASSTAVFRKLCSIVTEEEWLSFVQNKSLHLMHLAASYGCADIIDKILDSLPNNAERDHLFIGNQLGNTSLHTVMHFFSENPNVIETKKIIEKLLKRASPKERAMLFEGNEKGQTPLHLIIPNSIEIKRRGDIHDMSSEIVEYLLKLSSEQEKEKLLQHDHQGYTPLHVAVEKNASKILCKIIWGTNKLELPHILAQMKSADVNGKDYTPIQLAFINKKNKILELFVFCICLSRNFSVAKMKKLYCEVVHTLQKISSNDILAYLHLFTPTLIFAIGSKLESAWIRCNGISTSVPSDFMILYKKISESYEKNAEDRKNDQATMCNIVGSISVFDFIAMHRYWKGWRLQDFLPFCTMPQQVAIIPLLTNSQFRKVLDKVRISKWPIIIENATFEQKTVLLEQQVLLTSYVQKWKIELEKRWNLKILRNSSEHQYQFAEDGRIDHGIVGEIIESFRIKEYLPSWSVILVNLSKAFENRRYQILNADNSFYRQYLGKIESVSENFLDPMIDKLMSKK
jgi:ankyrin repeat protein